ncbi:MAG: 1-deoxy-D-xylulose-5-phosphate synthase, partial [Zoogloeaceae bacterium]|nr:1-deoxy-D-xylulose-5-phosphate synthase [Zoogloeaceae bacterium]
GLVGADGATHHGSYDLSFLACIPNLVIMTPADEAECRRMFSTAHQLNAPAAVRYPRGSGTGIAPETNLETLPVGKGVLLREGTDVALLAFGSRVAPALAAGETLHASVANMRFVKPLDADLVEQLARQHTLLVSIEENAVIGGAGSEIARVLEERKIPTPLLRLGLPDRFIEHGEQSELLAELGLDAKGIVGAVRAFRNTAT